MLMNNVETIGNNVKTRTKRINMKNGKTQKKKSSYILRAAWFYFDRLRGIKITAVINTSSTCMRDRTKKTHTSSHKKKKDWMLPATYIHTRRLTDCELQPSSQGAFP